MALSSVHVTTFLESKTGRDGVGQLQCERGRGVKIKRVGEAAHAQAGGSVGANMPSE
jgi:hypothetical protein